MKYKRKNFCHMLGAELYLFTHKRSFWFAFWVMLLFSGGTYLIDVRNNFGIDISSTLRACDHFVLNYWVEGIPYFSVFFPFLVTFPVAFPSRNMLEAVLTVSQEDHVHEGIFAGHWQLFFPDFSSCVSHFF